MLVHGAPCPWASAAVATSREVMSARSMQRTEHQELPARRRGSSSRPRSPLISAARSRTQRKEFAGRRARNCPVGMARYVVLMASHIGTDSVSRARRALSRAAPSAAATEAGEAGS